MGLLERLEALEKNLGPSTNSSLSDGDVTKNQSMELTAKNKVKMVTAFSRTVF